MARNDNKTARRTLAIFEAFHQRKAPLSLTELARIVQAPMSSCHGIVRTMTARGYLYNVDASRNLYPTKRLLQIAETIVRNDPLLRRITSSLGSLRDACGETVVLGKWQSSVVVYLDVAESRQTIRFAARPGQAQPVAASSIGKAILAEMDDKGISAWLKAHPLRRTGTRINLSLSQLRRQLKAARVSGYCISDGETDSDVMAVAVTIPSNDDPLGVSIAGPRARIEPRINRHGALLLKFRQDIVDAN